MKNYMVESLRLYGGAVLSIRRYYYKYYFMANFRSIFEYHFLGRDCYIFVRNGANVKHRQVVLK